LFFLLHLAPSPLFQFPSYEFLPFPFPGMLKYQKRSSKEEVTGEEMESTLSSSQVPSRCLLSRSDSLTSISSLETSSDWSPLRIDVSAVNPYSHYKTIRVTPSQCVSSIVPLLLSKLKLPSDCDYELWMEIKTRSEGSIVVSSLRLLPDWKPLELEKCLPEGMSRFFLFS
ncbi:hypothetical protein PMAYCL1PPCAC_23772, partial [Pristionchus mayeri]